MNGAASRERIAKAGKCWYKILGVGASASVEEVKKTFRQLALLHHPDKPDGDGDTFKSIQEAYVVGLRRCSKQTPAKPRCNVDVGTDSSKAAQPKPKEKRKADPAKSKQERPAKRMRPKPWVVPPGASDAKIRKAVELYEDSEQWDDKTFPDQIRVLSPQEVATQLQAGSCTPVDVREANAQSGVEIQGAVRLSYSQMIFSPHEAAPTISSLRKDGKRLVLFSEQPGLMGTCGMVGAILLDVFSFQEDLVCRLDGGCVAWEQYLDTNTSVARVVEPLVMRLQRRKRTAAARVAAENAMADAVGLENSMGRSMVAEEGAVTNVSVGTGAMLVKANTEASSCAFDKLANDNVAVADDLQDGTCASADATDRIMAEESVDKVETISVAVGDACMRVDEIAMRQNQLRARDHVDEKNGMTDNDAAKDCAATYETDMHADTPHEAADECGVESNETSGAAAMQSSWSEKSSVASPSKANQEPIVEVAQLIAGGS